MELIKGKEPLKMVGIVTLDHTVLRSRVCESENISCSWILADGRSPDVSWQFDLHLHPVSGRNKPYDVRGLHVFSQLELTNSLNKAVRAELKVHVRQRGSDLDEEYENTVGWTTYEITENEPKGNGYTGCSGKFFLGWSPWNVLSFMESIRSLDITLSVSWIPSPEDMFATFATKDIASKLLGLHSSGTLADVVFVVGEEEVAVPAHSHVLAAMSQVFSRMFQADTEDKRTGRVRVEDATAAPFKEMLRCVYTGWQPRWGKTSEEDLVELTYLAKKYDLERLLWQCECRMVESLLADNLCERLRVASTLGLRGVKESIISYVLANREVLESEKWNSLQREHPEVARDIVSTLLQSEGDIQMLGRPPPGSDYFYWIPCVTSCCTVIVDSRSLKSADKDDPHLICDTAETDVALWEFSLSLKAGDGTEPADDPSEKDHANVVCQVKYVGEEVTRALMKVVVREKGTEACDEKAAPWTVYYTGQSQSLDLLCPLDIPHSIPLHITVSVTRQADVIKDAGATYLRDVPNFRRSYVDKLQALFTSQTLADVVFVVGEDEVPAHSQILAAVSQVFSSMFQGDTGTEGKKTGRVIVEDATAAPFRQMLRFVYARAEPEWSDISDDDLRELAYLAHKFALPDLLALCSPRLVTMLRADNICKIFKTTCQISLLSVMDHVLVYVKANPQVLHTEDWRRLQEDEPEVAWKAFCFLLKGSIGF